MTSREGLLLVLLVMLTAAPHLRPPAAHPGPILAPITPPPLPSLPPAEIVLPAPSARQGTSPGLEPRAALVLARVTSYCPCALCTGENSRHGITRYGYDTRDYPYGVAADPGVFPAGTLIRVPGYMNSSFPDEFWPVDDTGSAMTRSKRRGVVHIDLRMKTHYSAARWGVRYLMLEVIPVTND